MNFKGNTTDPELAVFFSIFGSQGEDVTISVERVESDLDPAFYIYEGLFEDASEFGGAFGFGDRFLAFADGQTPPTSASACQVPVTPRYSSAPVETGANSHVPTIKFSSEMNSPT